MTIKRIIPHINFSRAQQEPADRFHRMTSTLHTCMHCGRINTVYLIPGRMDLNTCFEYDCHDCDGYNVFQPTVCIRSDGELPDRAICAQVAGRDACRPQRWQDIREVT